MAADTSKKQIHWGFSGSTGISYELYVENSTLYVTKGDEIIFEKSDTHEALFDVYIEAMAEIIKSNDEWPIKNADNRLIDNFSNSQFYAQLKKPKNVVRVGVKPSQKSKYEDNCIGDARRAIAAMKSIPDALQKHNITTAEELAKAFNYSVSIDTQKEKCKLGASKVGGLPHLGKGMRWPKDHYFYAQVNLADIKQYDITDSLPEEGVIYHFITPDGDGKILFYSGPQSELKERKYPKGFEIASHFKSTYEQEEKMSFKAGYFFMGADTFLGNAIDHKIMNPLISKALKIEVNLIARSDGDRLFGEPQTWQEEESILKGNDLFMQLNYGDGLILSGVSYKNIQKGKLGRAVAAYSGS